MPTDDKIPVLPGTSTNSEAPVFTVPEAEANQTLAALIKRHGIAESWNAARDLIERGKVFVEGSAVTDPTRRLRAGTQVALKMTARRLAPLPPGRIAFEDAQVVVFDKPAGVSSVPYEKRETGTAMDLIREHWKPEEKHRGMKAGDVPLHILHRIDKDTSGLIMFAKTKAAEKVLAANFRTHDIERTYICVVHGHLTDRRIETRLVEDRGDGLRGSTRHPTDGKRAVTHVTVVAEVGSSATMCEVRLETGKTHQIRIHLAENGHPLVGETVYIRDWAKKEMDLIPSPRLLLHAATLGFLHPITGESMRFESPLPPDFEAVLRSLAKR